MRIKYLSAAVLSLALAACGSEDEGTKGNDGGKQQTCSTAEYVAFDPVNHQPQDARLAAIDEMLARFAEAQQDPTLAAQKAADVLAIYQSADTKLQEKVQGRQDVHFTDDAAVVGPELDATFLAAIADLGAATTAQEVKLAKQTFEKAAVYRFLYLSVMYELHEPSKKHYDEAYGYFGSGATNAEAGRKGLARLATKRDENNQTTQAAEIFGLILEGRCVLAEALAASGTETIEMGDVPAYDQIVERIDGKLQVLMAYSIGHELIDIVRLADNADDAAVKLWEAEGFFRVVEPYLATGTTDEQTFATEFRAALDEAMAAEDASWLESFDAEGFLLTLEEIFAIDVKA